MVVVHGEHSKNTMKTSQTVIGRGCLVRDLKVPQAHLYCGATVIDQVFKTNNAKRIRLQTGEHAGEVRMRGEYEIMEFL